MANQDATAAGSGSRLHVAPLARHTRQAPPTKIGKRSIPSIYYSDYIKRLDYQVIDPRQYRHERKPGPDERDVTSFVPSQKNWGGERDQRPDVLFELNKPPLQNLPEPGYLLTPAPTKAFDELSVVIHDYDDKPLLNFPELPITISTRVEGWLLEAWMRSNLQIRIDDVIQRMPYLPDDKRECVRDQGGFSNTLSGRRRDFRKTGRCLSWADNSANASVYDRKVIEEVEANPEWYQNNTTRSLEDLTKAQRERIEKENTAASTKRRAQNAERRRNGSGPSPGNDNSSFPGNATTPETSPSTEDEDDDEGDNKEQRSTGRARKRTRTHGDHGGRIPFPTAVFGPRLDSTGHHFDPFSAFQDPGNNGFEASGVHVGSQHTSTASVFPEIHSHYHSTPEIPSISSAQADFERLFEAPLTSTHMPPVFSPAQNEINNNPADWLPDWSPDDSADHFTTTNIPTAPSSEPLRSGMDLINWFEDGSIQYMRRDHVQRTPHVTDDQRFSCTINSNDRQQLFFALYPAISFAVQRHSTHRFTINLDTYYSSAYNGLQDQFVHAAYLADPTVNLHLEEERLQPRATWSGSIASFDDAESAEIWWDQEAREKKKGEACPYMLGMEFQRKAGEQRRLSPEDTNRVLVTWPRKIVVEAGFELLTLRDVVRLVDFE